MSVTIAAAVAVSDASVNSSDSGSVGVAASVRSRWQLLGSSISSVPTMPVAIAAALSGATDSACTVALTVSVTVSGIVAVTVSGSVAAITALTLADAMC